MTSPHGSHDRGRTGVARTRAAMMLSLSLGLSLSLSAVACTSDQGDEATDVVNREQAQSAAQERRDRAQIEAAREALPDRPSGIVDIDGATRGSLTADAAEAQEGSSGLAQVRVGDNGAEEAFASLCAGGVDLVDSARPMSEAEWRVCQDAGLDVVQLQIASEAVVVAIRSETDVGGDCLSVPEVEEIYRAGSPLTNWNQLGLDDVTLGVGGPDSENNAFGFFGRTVLDAPEPSMANLRSDYRAFDTDAGSREYVVGRGQDQDLARWAVTRKRQAADARRVLVAARQRLYDAKTEVRAATEERDKGIRDQRSAADQAADQARLDTAYQVRGKALGAYRTADAAHRVVARRSSQASAALARINAVHGRVAYFRFSYYELFEDQLRPFEVTDEGEDDCIFPSQRTITSGAYPLGRQLLITTTTRSLERSEVRRFLTGYLTGAQDQATSERLVPLPDALVATQLAWVAGGTEPEVFIPDDATEATPAPPPEPVS
ncbi:PstS family phosphate ABC transporter substrate-binding protein [Nocardioides pacificus]